MPPVKMTRAEYEAKYGGAPSASTTAPIKMTRAEYDEKYNAPKEPVNTSLATPFKSGAGFGANTKAFVGNVVKDVPGMVRGILENVVKAPSELAGVFKESATPSAAVKNLYGGYADTLKSVGEGIAGGIAGVGNIVAGSVSALGKKLTGKSLIPSAEQRGAETGQAIGEFGFEHPVQTAIGLVGGAEGAVSKVVSPIAKPLQTGLTRTAEVVSDTVKKLTTKSEAQIESAILNKYEKGVKPLISGKLTPAKLENYRSDVVTAIKTVKENAPNLTFTDEVGGVIKGQTPKSLQQFSDAIDQTKKTIFQKYDALAKQAGEAGVAVDVFPIASELDTVIGNKALGITNPRAIEYAKSLKERLSQVGRIDANTGQEVVQNYNKSLEAFYRNPTYDTASQAAIDALVANKFRQALDEGISGLTGAQYSELKGQYGALKAVEKDVIKASLRDARKNAKGLLDYSDILTSGQVINGILSLNPAVIAQGGVGFAIKEFYKYLNNPNRAIEKMFKATEKLPQSLKPNNRSTTSLGEGKTLFSSQPANSVSAIPSKNAIFTTIPEATKKSSQIKYAEAKPMEIGTYKVAKNPITKREEIVNYRKPGVSFYPKKPIFLKDEGVIPKTTTYAKETLPENLKNNYEQFPRDKNLKGEDAEIQEQSILKYLSEKDTLMDRYIKEHGKVANADNARKLFKDVGYRGTNAASVQEAASALNKDIFRKLLIENPESEATLLAGGSGVGKSTAVNKLLPNLQNKNSSILDGNLSTLKTARNRLKEIDDAGKIEHIVYVYREPVDSWVNGVIKRMLENPKEEGRLVPLSVFMENHKGSYDVVKQFIQEGLNFSLIDNSLGIGNAQFMPLDKFNKISYDSFIKTKLLNKTKQLYENGTITKEQYGGLIR